MNSEREEELGSFVVAASFKLGDEEMVHFSGVIRLPIKRERL